jgi:hypothetical protein
MKLIKQCLFITAFIAVSLFLKAQKIDTIYKAKAFSNTYISLPFYGTTSNGHIWSAGLNNHYDNNNESIEMVRIDLTTNKVTYKTLEGTRSSSSVYWSYTFDSLGNFYLGLNTNNRKIFKFNLKDSIWYQNLGDAFLDNQALAYSLSLGLDNHVYFGASSGRTFWSEYDPKTGSLIKHEAIDPKNNYVLAIMGDTSWIYAELGQRNSIDMWAVRKVDDYKVKLFSIPNNTRFNTHVLKDGISIQFYTDTLAGTFILKNGKAIKGILKAQSIAYDEINNANHHTTITTYYDNTASNFIYSINGEPYKTVHINASNIRNNIRFMFFDEKDPSGFGYVGDYYGNWYWYNHKSDSAYLLGTTGFNVYSSAQYNDSIFYFGNYPSGALLKWNKNQKWTAQKFINGSIVGGKNPNANPKVVGFFKSETPAGFHHASILKIYNDNVVSAGDVIRIGNTCSIGVYNIKKDSMYGYDYHKIDRLSAVDVIKYEKFYILSTSNENGGKSKLYFYDPAKNIMADSLDFNFSSYGNLYLKGDELTGVAKSFLYKVNLKTRKLIRKDSLTEQIFFSMQLSDGRIAINTKAALPKGFADFLVIPYSVCYESNNSLYAIINKNIVIRIRDIDKVNSLK